MQIIWGGVCNWLDLLIFNILKYCSILQYSLIYFNILQYFQYLSVSNQFIPFK